jgi:hypothetical protein
MRRFASLRKYLVWTIVVASIIWTAYDWNGLSSIKTRLGALVAVVISLILSECLFLLGACLVAVAVGKHVFADCGGKPIRIAAAIRRVRRSYKSLASTALSSRLFRLGFNLNWIGAAATGLILALGILLALPVHAWGLLLLPILDIAATFGWRMPIAAKLRSLERSN